ncbi:hypothetical protein [Chitinophaga rhizosphaerae]|uniref:hypothetical protein n=1 Tax=Chitinophaga rhizosphaerae TaxID=1864947 RepID=UPI000F7FC388|nr:hypothetical protein [Chitinophaga rhizosphaerae]
MQKSTYIKEKVEELARQLFPLGISHITIYITGSRDLFSPALPISSLPFNDGELLFQEMKNNWEIPITVILKASSI